MVSLQKSKYLSADQNTLSATKIASWSNALQTRTYFIKNKLVTKELISNFHTSFIPRGAGRSFGDAAYITNGITLSSQNNSKIFNFDMENGKIICGAGVKIVELLNYIEDSDWIFPVYGGTQWATIGGAIASDIHGKNDEFFGSFGNHIESITILTSNGQTIECSKEINSDLFAATIGGMGLTGFIYSAKLKLTKKIAGSLRCNTKLIRNIEEMLSCFEEFNGDFKFCTWLTWPHNNNIGIYHYATFVDTKSNLNNWSTNLPLPSIDLLNSFSVRIASSIKELLYPKPEKIMHVRDFNYFGPYEHYLNWNKLYGKNGMIEFQFIISVANLVQAFNELINTCQKQSIRLYNIVIKKHGSMPREGLLSFPEEGYSINFQVKNKPENRKTLIQFANLLIDFGSKIYLTKDSCILSDQFEKMYTRTDQWRAITKKYDGENRIQSDLSNRLKMKPW